MYMWGRGCLHAEDYGGQREGGGTEREERGGEKDRKTIQIFLPGCDLTFHFFLFSELCLSTNALNLTYNLSFMGYAFCVLSKKIFAFPRLLKISCFFL